MGGPTGPLVALTDVSLMMEFDPVTLGNESILDHLDRNDFFDCNNSHKNHKT
jgi:hypothetical protein